MQLKIKSENTKYSIIDLGIRSVETAVDIHPHTSYSDGELSLSESIEEARKNGVYEKGIIEHGNPNDEDIEHLTTFLDNFEEGNQPYTSLDIYPYKFDNLETVLEDIDGSTTLTDADPGKIREDLETLEHTNETYSNVRLEDCLNYSMIIPHGVELDYNPAIEFTDKVEKPIESYENALIDFLRDAESRNSGYNYVLLSSHYVNTPFEPRYVKKEELFEGMSHGELGEVLKHYKEKEISKIESLSSKLGDLSIPAISEELMFQREIDELEKYVHDQSRLVGNIAEEEIESKEYLSVAGEEIEIARPGVFAVGAHPTLIERNEVLLDYFRKEQGLTKKNDLLEGSDKFSGDARTDSLYPREALKEYYEDIIKVSESEDNFIFEINGKGVERQHPSVFWEMLGNHTFGSDAHRLGEQPRRSIKYENAKNSGETVFLSELWLDQLEKDNNDEKEKDSKQIQDYLPKTLGTAD